MGHDSPAQVAGPRSDIDEVIAGSHQRLIVFNHDDRVPLLLQIAEGGDEPVVVARMQADRRFVEQIENSDKPGADSGGQTHALPLAAAECVGSSIEREIVGANSIEKGEPGAGTDSKRIGPRGWVHWSRG